MKIIINEHQYNNLFLEQKPDSDLVKIMKKVINEQTNISNDWMSNMKNSGINKTTCPIGFVQMSQKEISSYDKQLVKPWASTTDGSGDYRVINSTTICRRTQLRNDPNKVVRFNLDPHIALLITEIAVAFIPVVGPFLSVGVGLADAALYYKEGDTKMAGLSAMFSLLPGAGQLVSKIPGIKKLGSKGLNMLAKKIGTGQKLTQTELSVANGLAANKDLVKSNLNLLTKQLAEKHASRIAARKEVLKFGGTIGGYHGLGKGYDYAYDKIAGDNSIPKTLNLNAKVSDVNREAAKNIKWD